MAWLLWLFQNIWLLTSQPSARKTDQVIVVSKDGNFNLQYVAGDKLVKSARTRADLSSPGSQTTT
jgi:hypothetical protein